MNFPKTGERRIWTTNTEEKTSPAADRDTPFPSASLGKKGAGRERVQPASSWVTPSRARLVFWSRGILGFLGFLFVVRR